jgi:predicted CopG family antitoxin
VLDDFSGESILVEENVLKQVKRLKEKQKSKNEILYKLVERKEDKEIVMSCIEKVFCEDDEIKILKKQIEKLKIR